MFEFELNFHWSLFPRVQLTAISIPLGNGLAPNRWQAITWNNVEHDLCRLMASLTPMSQFRPCFPSSCCTRQRPPPVTWRAFMPSWAASVPWRTTMNRRRRPSNGSTIRASPPWRPRWLASQMDSWSSTHHWLIIWVRSRLDLGRLVHFGHLEWWCVSLVSLANFLSWLNAIAQTNAT